MSIARRIAHLVGWHTNSCRGDYRHCWRPNAIPVHRGLFAGWWRDA